MRYAVTLIKNYGLDRLKDLSYLIRRTANDHQTGQLGDPIKGAHMIANVCLVSLH